MKYIITNVQNQSKIEYRSKAEMLDALIQLANATDVIKVINSNIGYYVLMNYVGKIKFIGMNSKLDIN